MSQADGSNPLSHGGGDPVPPADDSDPVNTVSPSQPKSPIQDILGLKANQNSSAPSTARPPDSTSENMDQGPAGSVERDYRNFLDPLHTEEYIELDPLFQDIIRNTLNSKHFLFAFLLLSYI